MVPVFYYATTARFLLPNYHHVENGPERHLSKKNT